MLSLWLLIGTVSPNILTPIIFFVSLTLARYVLQVFYRLGIKYPPEPRPWPVIGNLLHIIGDDPHKKLAKMASVYGGVLMVHLGPVRALVLSDLQVFKHVMIREADIYSDREQPKFIEEAFQSEGSVLWENGPVWKRHRRMIHNAFRQLGFRQKQFHFAITLEITALCASLESRAGTPFDFRHLLTSTTANVICTICFGQRYEYDAVEFSNAVSSMLNISKSMSGISLAHLIPKLYHTPLYNKLRENVNTLNAFIQDNVREHRASFDPDRIRDVVDVYLSNEAPGQADTVWRGLFDMFTAGSETTADSTLWAILYLIIHPEIQEKVQEELDSVTLEELSQYPENINLLPYSYATLMEVHRHQSVAPLSLPHVTSADTILHGDEIPKGTNVWVNEWAIHNDPTFWGDPDVFRPSRFLDPNDRTKILREKTQHMILFGYGLRQCLGKRLAEMENFLLFCGLFRRFSFSAPKGTTLSTTGHFGLTYSPLPFDICLEVRKSANV